MKLIKMAAGVLNQTPLDWCRNKNNILAAIAKGRRDQVSILCLPELCITGYGCEDAFLSSGVQDTAIEILMSIVKESQGIVVSVGLPMMYAGGLFNAACLIVDGKIAGLVAKQHLAGDGIHYEPRWFKKWPEGVDSKVELAGDAYPFGDLLFEVGGVRIGFEICEDAWVGSRPGARHSSRGADVILNPSASHFAFGKHQVRRRFVTEGSRAFHVTYVYTNLVGNEAGRAIYDGDAMLASGGELVAEGRRFSYQPVTLTSATVNVDATRMARARMGSFEPDVDGDETDVIDIDFQYPQCELQHPDLAREAWEQSEHIKFEEFTRSASLGLFDYMCKSRSGGLVISASGGVDSTAVMIIGALMLRLAEDDLGTDELAVRLQNVCTNHTPDGARLARQLITTVYQKTRNSSETTQTAAATVAKAIGTTHLELDVDGLVERYTAMISETIDRELSWDQDDIVLQNIQARARSPGIWMLANLNRALLLSTSNRSESAVGYATMDGDTSGGLAPIAGIDKAFLRRWLRWIEQQGPDQLGPIPEVKCVNDQQPTAELRPPESEQTDEGDLMPYEVLDVIERFAIRDKLMPLSVFKHLKINFEMYSNEQLATWTKRFFRLWCRNQWKRERLAPSFHYDDENLDPKTWCRFPILSGGFERELRQLDDYLEGLQSTVGPSHEKSPLPPFEKGGKNITS